MQWSTISQLEKIRLAVSVKRIVGLAGAGISPAFFMRPGGVVIEIYPRKGWGRDTFLSVWKGMCDAKQHRYLGVLSSELIAQGETLVTHLNISELKKAVRSVA